MSKIYEIEALEYIAKVADGGMRDRYFTFRQVYVIL